MARNTKPVPLAEKGWVITMKKISIILLSAVLVFSMAACNGGKEKADNQTEKQTESVKPTEEVAMATEAVTEVTTEAGSDETEKDIAEAKDSEEKTDKEDNRSADNKTASKQEEKPKQNDEPEQKAPVNDNEEAGGNQSNAGNGGQTTDSPKDNVSNPQPASVAYSPQNVVSLATAKCQAGGMITTQQNLQNHLNDGSITQEEYNEYYPYDGMEGSYYSVFVETDLNKASTGTKDVEETDADGNVTTVTKSVLYVNVTLKSYRDMISVYGFNSDQVEMLEQIMSPEFMGQLGYAGSGSGGGGGSPGVSSMTEDEINAILSGITDSRQKTVCSYALHRVGFPYSQDLRDSGNYYDCSSLAYYSWKDAGVDISYGGATTAAAEAQGLDEAGKTVSFDELQPGDLIFYSFTSNGRYKNISHVAVYVGNGKVVEALNESLGVVYRDVASTGKIVVIGRP
jgi:cell wall-associated NlpC family hydrolase